MVRIIDNKYRAVPDAIVLADSHLRNKFAFSNKALQRPVERFFPTNNLMARGLLGGLEALQEAVIKNAKTNNTSPQDVIDAMLQQNHKWSYSVSNESALNALYGRTAISELVEYINGQSTHINVVNKYTCNTDSTTSDILNDIERDPELSQKFNGVVWLLSRSFVSETENAYPNETRHSLTEIRAQILASIISNSIVHCSSAFDEFAVNDKNLFFVGKSSLRYSEYIALGLTMRTIRDFGETINGNCSGATEPFAVPVPPVNLAYGLQSIIQKFLKLETNTNLSGAIEKNLQSTESLDTYLDSEQIVTAFSRLNTPKEELTAEDADLFNVLSVYVFSYDVGTGQNVFCNELLPAPFTETMYRLSKTFFAYEAPIKDLALEHH